MDRFLLSRRFVVAGRKSGPAAETLGRTELIHIGAEFGNDGDGRISVDTRNGAQKCDSIFVYFNHAGNTGIRSFDQILYVRKMVAHNADPFFLFICDGISFNGFYYGICFFFNECCKSDTQCAGSKTSSDVR